MESLKNPVFIHNITDPINNKYVKNIYMKKVSKKTNREIWFMEWNYYKNRGNYSVRDVYKHNIGKTVRVTYSGDPKIYEFMIPKMES